MSKKPLYMLTYDHGGYLVWGKHFSQSLKSAMEWMDKYPKFKLGLDNEAFAYDRYETENPELMELIRYVQKNYKNRFSVGSSTYGQPLSVFISGESNVRQMVYAIRTDLEHLNTRPYVFTISEHALHSQIPQLALQTGYKMAIMRTHFQMYGYNPTYDSGFGLWYGDDGSAIPTIPTYDGQGAHFGGATMDNYILTRWPKEWDVPMEAFEKKFSHIEPLLASRYDDVTLRCEEMAQHAEEVDNYFWVTLEDLPQIYDAYRDNMDAYRPRPNEFKVRMPWGYCGNRIFNDCRTGEILAAQTERLCAMAARTGFTPDEKKLEQAWKGLLISQHHDVQICGMMRENAAFLKESRDAAEPAKADALNWIVRQMASGEESCVVVVNPSGKTVTQQVTAAAGRSDYTGSAAFTAVCGKEAVPCAGDPTRRSNMDAETNFNLRFTATVPPLSAKVYTLHCTPTDTPAEVSSAWDQGHLTTQYYELQLSDGGICWMRDRQSGRMLIQNPDNGRLFAGVIQDQPMECRGFWTVSCRPMLCQAIYTGEIGGILIHFTMDFAQDSRLIRCHTVFEHHGEKIGHAKYFEFFRDNTNGFIHEEKLRFVMQVPFEGAVSGLRDRPFLVEPTDDHYVEGLYWACVGNEKLAMAVYNQGSMCVTREADCLSIPLAYDNTYAWGSRPLWGEFTHDFALRPLEGGMDPVLLQDEAIAYNYPLLTASVPQNQEGVQELCFLPLETEENVRMTAFYPENGKLLLRVYEDSGKDGRLSVPGFSLTRTDAFGEPTAKPTAEQVLLKPHEIATFALEMI